MIDVISKSPFKNPNNKANTAGEINYQEEEKRNKDKREKMMQREQRRGGGSLLSAFSLNMLL